MLRPRREARMVLFIDFDGVLHPRPGPDRDSEPFCSLHLLEGVLRRAPDAEVVISSSWRERHGIDEMREYFAEDLRERIVGFTPLFGRDFDATVSSLRQFPRHAECVAWLSQNRSRETPWLALDDTPEEFAPDCTHLFAIDGDTGLTPSTAAMLLRRLKDCVIT
jgi:hypothetical protein